MKRNPPRGGRGTNQYKIRGRSITETRAAGSPVRGKRLFVEPGLESPFTGLWSSAEIGPVVDRFVHAGEPVFVVGGPVRDVLDGNHPSDVDLTTPADPERIRQLVDGLGTVNMDASRFGTVAVYRRRDDGTTETVEITQFRVESYDPSSRKPVVAPSRSLHEDLARRDFTVNAMAVDCATGELHDPFNGNEDLADRVLRTPVDANRTFYDDPLRVARLVRFAVTKNMTVEPGTLNGAQQQAHRLGTVVAPERRLRELDKILVSSQEDVVVRAARVARQVGVHRELFARFDPDRVPSGTVWPTSRTERLAVLASTCPPEDAHRSFNELMFSHADRDRAVLTARWVARIREGTVTETDLRWLVRDTPDEHLDEIRVVCRVWQVDMSRFDRVREQAGRWRAPWPVNGHDATAAGLRGPQVGAALREVHRAWLEDPDRVDRATALAMLAAASRRAG